MTRRTLLLLAGSAVLLGGYTLLFERGRPTVGGETGRILPRLQRDGIRRVRISWADAGRKLELHREGKGKDWRFTAAGLSGRADREVVSRLLSLLEFLEQLRQVPRDSNRRQLGLAPPRAVLEIWGSSSAVVGRIEVGRPDPSGHGVYIARGTGLHVVDRELAGLLDMDLQTWRERQLIPGTAATIRRIRITRNGTQLEIRAKGPGRTWRLGAGEGAVRAIPTAARRLVAAMVGLRAVRFVDSTGRLPSTLEAEIESSTGRWRLLVGPACPGRSTERLLEISGGQRGPSTRCCVAHGDLELLEAVTPESLMDRRLIRMGEPDLEKISIHGSGTRAVELVRQAGRWRFSGADAELSVVRDWVHRLGAIEGLRVELDVAGAEDLGRIELSAADGNAALRFGKPRGVELPVQRSGERAVIWVQAGEVTPVLSLGPHHFRQRRVLTVPRHLVSRLSTQRGGEREVVSRTDGGWRVIEPIESRADQSHMTRLLEKVTRLTATRFVAKPPAQPQQRVMLEVVARGATDGKRPELTRIELELGPPERPCYGRVKTKGPWFELEPATCQLIGRRRAQRRLLSLGEGGPHAIEIIDGMASLLAEKRGPTWVDGKSGRSLPTTVIADLVRELRAMNGRILKYGVSSAPRRWLSVRVRLAGKGWVGFLADRNGRGHRIGGQITFELDRGTVERLRGLLARARTTQTTPGR